VTVSLEGFSGWHELSSGTLAHVYRATEVPLGRTVIVKCLKPTLLPDSAFAEPLVREARILAALNHPNIESLHRFIKTDRTLALVLEHVEGRSLRRALDDRPLVAAEVMAIGFEIARGLAHAHGAGVVHADIKPSNVIVGSDGNVKLIDFGIARANSLPSDQVLASRVAGPGLFGTPAYMSPEQLLSDEIDHRSDVYSLGVILYEALAGRLPIDRREARDPGSRTRIDSLERVAQGVPFPLCRIVMRCLEPAPSRRYPSADQLANELGELLADLGAGDRAQLISAVGSGTPPVLTGRKPDAKTRRWMQPATLGLAAVVAFAMGAALCGRQRDVAVAIALPMAPPNGGSLRVTAAPWAEVYVDGERIDVTPIGRPIALSAGVHQVSFRHPKSPREQRKVDIRPGEVTTLNVLMTGLSHGGKR
jgi:serine/threonine-protein kinase